MCIACGNGIPQKGKHGLETLSSRTGIQTIESSHSLSITFDSTLQAMSAAVQACRIFLKDKMLSEDTRYHIVLRELFLNAIQHGNQMDPSKKVAVHVEWIPDSEVRIQVEDCGPGFDYHAVNMWPPENLTRMKQRGYVLIHALCDDIAFNENGNCVVVHLCL